MIVQWWHLMILAVSGMIIGAMIMRVYLAFRQARTRYISRELEQVAACAREERRG